MPIIEEVDDSDVQMAEDNEADLDDLLKQLAIPPDFNRPDYLSENPSLAIEAWKRKTTSVLDDIRRIVNLKDSRNLAVDAYADIVFSVAPFASTFPADGADTDAARIPADWVEDEAGAVAEAILSAPPLSATPELVREVLTRNLKPIFKASPHPHLNTETGRKLGNYAGGPMAMQDYYEGQVWKNYPGIGKVVLWCVCNTPENAYENTWHLIIPPVMTLLDDYEARHKLEGVYVVQEMLRHVPKDLLKRTGIAGLLQQSLRTSLSHLQSPETAELVRNAIGASLSLILLTTSIAPGSKAPSERFEELSSLLGQGIISGIWLYAEDKPGVVHATFDALPALLTALDIGSVRFLKSLIPQLGYSLIPRPLVNADRELQLAALRVFKTLFAVCGPRIPFWKETILDAIARCWVGLMDDERKGLSLSAFDQKQGDEMKQQLQSICADLARVCPSVIENEYPRFMKADKELFQNLLPHIGYK